MRRPAAGKMDVLLIRIVLPVLFIISGCKGSSSNFAGALNESSASIDAPGGLSASGVSLSRIYLSWTDNSTGETGFIIECSTGSSFSQDATPTANITSYSDTGLSAETVYIYRVYAYNTSGNSA